MLFSTPTAMPVQLMGPLAGNANVENLQRALKNLSVATQRPDIDPGAIDGVVGAGTVTAITAGMSFLTRELPAWAELPLQAALAVGGSTSKGKEAIIAAAVPLTVAANTAAQKYRVAPVALTPVNAAVDFFKTPQGMLALLLGALIAYKLFFAPKESTRSAA